MKKSVGGGGGAIVSNIKEKTIQNVSKEGVNKMQLDIKQRPKGM